MLSHCVYIVQILYKDSEHADGAAAEAEASASADDGGVSYLCHVILSLLRCIYFNTVVAFRSRFSFEFCFPV